MAFSASAPNPTAASCNACLRVKNFFMAFLRRYSVAVQEIVSAHHRLQKQAQTLFRIGIFGDRLLRDVQLLRVRLPGIGGPERQRESVIEIAPALFEYLLRECLADAHDQRTVQ